jgi:hypothetical protein
MRNAPEGGERRRWDGRELDRRLDPAADPGRTFSCVRAGVAFPQLLEERLSRIGSSEGFTDGVESPFRSTGYEAPHSSDPDHLGKHLPEQRHAALDMAVRRRVHGETVDSLNEACCEDLGDLVWVAQGDHRPNRAGVLGAH